MSCSNDSVAEQRAATAQRCHGVALIHYADVQRHAEDPCVSRPIPPDAGEGCGVVEPQAARQRADLCGRVGRVAHRDVAARATQQLERIVVLQETDAQAKGRLQRVKVDTGRQRIPDDVDFVVDATLLGIEAELRTVETAAQCDSLGELVGIFRTQPERTDLEADGVPLAECRRGRQSQQTQGHRAQHRLAPDLDCCVKVAAATRGKRLTASHYRCPANVAERSMPREFFHGCAVRRCVPAAGLLAAVVRC